MSSESLWFAVITLAVGLFVVTWIISLVRRSLRRVWRALGFGSRRTWRRQSDYVTIGTTNNGRPIYEHRKIAERILNRKLGRGEVVHHINGLKDDNRLSNLCVMRHEAHESYHAWHDWIVDTYGKHPTRPVRLRKLREEFHGVVLSDFAADVKPFRRSR